MFGVATLPDLPVGDYGDLTQVALTLAVVIVYAVTTRRSSTKSEAHTVHEQVDNSVLGRFEGLFERISRLEASLDETKLDLARAMQELEELKAELRSKEDEIEALRVSYNISLAEKEKEIKSLRTSLENHRRRIKELETRQEADQHEKHQEPSTE